MTTALTQQFKTEFDGTGVNLYIQQMEKAQGVSGKTSGSIEGFFGKLERPLSFLAFTGLADQISGIGEKGESSSQMLERGMHVAALAVSYFNPLLGGLAVAGLAAFEILEKITKAKTSEEFQKEAEALTKEAEAAQKLIPVLLAKSDIDKATKDRLKGELDAANESAAAYQHQYEMAERNVTVRAQMIKSLQEELGEYEKAKIITKDVITGNMGFADAVGLSDEKVTKINIQLKEYNALMKRQVEDQNLLKGGQESYLALHEDAVKAAKKGDEDRINVLQKEYETLGKLYELEDEKGGKKKSNKGGKDDWVQQDIEQLAKMGVTWQAAVQQIKTQQQQVIELELQLTQATKEEDRKRLQDKITTLNDQIQAEQQVVQREQEMQQQRQQVSQQFAKQLMGESESFMKDFVTGNEKNLKKDLANWIDSYGTKLYAAAIADSFIDPLKAAAEFAGATALFALGASVGGGSTPGAGAGREGGSRASRSGTGGPAPNNVGITIVLQGTHVTDPNFSAQVAQGLQSYVQNSNGNVVASQVVTPSGQLVPASGG